MNRRINILMFLIFMIFFQNINSQTVFNYHNRIVNVVGKSNLSSKLIATNPALNIINQNYGGVFVSPSKLGISELNYGSAFFNYNYSNNLNLLVDVTGSTSDIFSDVIPSISLTFIDSLFSIGAKTSNNFMYIKDYNHESEIFFDIGGLIYLAENIDLGFALTNIFGNYHFGAKQYIQQTAAFGLGVELIKNLNIDLNVIMFVNYFTTISFSTSYNLNENLSLALSHQGNPGITGLDLLIQLESINIPLNISYYDYFGISFGFGVEIFLK